MLTATVILQALWKYKFIVLSLILLCVCLFQANIIQNERQEHSDKILKIERDNATQKYLLIDKARELERIINAQVKENAIIKQEKDDRVEELNSTINDNSDRLQQLTQQAIAADKRQCTNTVTTEVIEKVVRVPASKGSGELTAEMAKDFQRLSSGCALNYEKLKNEAVELEGWSDSILENSKIEIKK